MHALSAGELLDVWEAGFAQAPTERALALLAVACPETSRDALAALTIGARDASLLRLREGLWGPQMAAVVVCPGCQERLELTLDTGQMLASSQPALPSEIPLSIAEYNITFRLPTSLDMLAGVVQGAPEGGRPLLLERCLLSAQEGGSPVSPETLPAEVLAGVVKSMAEADPLADIQLELNCPACEQRWRAVFDIVSFLWTEIEVWAWRMLSDVHTLARAYGWHEREILSLSPTRRQFYLEMVGA
jgi:uncharacterized protein YbaR (Trm112 family)